jgi:hypothetical protein
MKQSDIKTESEQAYQNIKLHEDRLQQLRSICKHPNTYKANVYTQPGKYYPGIICSDCRKVIYNELLDLGKTNKEDI